MKKLILAVLIVLFMAAVVHATMTTLISATTGAVTTDTFQITEVSPSTIVANGLAGAEEIELQIEYADGSFVDVYDLTGSQVVLSATVTTFSITGRGCV